MVSERGENVTRRNLCSGSSEELRPSPRWRGFWRCSEDRGSSEGRRNDMAQVIRRTWKSGARKVKRTAYGYTLMVKGRQIRKYDAEWGRQDAQEALAAAILD